MLIWNGSMVLNKLTVIKFHYRLILTNNIFTEHYFHTNMGFGSQISLDSLVKDVRSFISQVAF